MVAALQLHGRSEMSNTQTTVDIKPEETETRELTLADLETVSGGKGSPSLLLKCVGRRHFDEATVLVS
jgi:hypothetical protein